MPHVGVPTDLIRTELDKILASTVFARADRASRLLRFVVEHALEEDVAALKEYAIGMSVLGRGESFDPRLDPIVRVEAGRLRSRLNEYYRTEGFEDPLVIDVPKGSYAPVFHQRPGAPHSSEDLPEAARDVPPMRAEAGERSRRRTLLLAASLVAAGLVGVAAALWMWFPTASAPVRSLAVLPLANLSGDPDQEYFADGMTEALITQLGRIEAVDVISRTSVMRYKDSRTPLPEIARQLKADAVLEGGVLRAGDRIRIMIKLIHARRDRQLWSETYDRSVSDVLALQDEVAQAVRAQVTEELTAGVGELPKPKRTVAPGAVDAYLKARYWENKRTAEGLKTAIEYYRQAITADANYALAHSGLGNAYVLAIAYGLVPAKEYFPKIRAAALRALELDDTLAEPHLLLGGVLTAYEWDWSAGERQYRRALALEPGFATAHQRYALALMWAGRFEAALAAIDRAQELDPLSPVLDMNECEILYNARRFRRAIEHCRTAIRRTPEFFQTHRILGEAYVADGQFAEAVAELKTAISLGAGLAAEGRLGHVYAISGNRTGAMEILRKLEHSGQTERFYDIAVIHAGLGDKDRAFQWLERSYAEGSRSLLFLRVAPVLEVLRGDPRFADLVRRRFKGAAR
jgi:TolB-like protein/tetratricopeptide (TPR) repeat protein